jgi:SPP1 gp7 family putative phage head morphogenesis protein
MAPTGKKASEFSPEFKKFQKEVSRLRSEVRDLKTTRKDINPFTGLATGNYWTSTGMPWVSGEGRKAVMTEYFWQPIRGQPRRVDTNELRQFSQTFWVNACVKTIIDEISSLDWDIVPKEGYEYEWVEEGITKVKEFLKKPNNNGESFQHILRATIKDILELDAGIIVKVFDIGSYNFDEIEPKSGAPMLKPMGERTMTEIYSRDGASFLKEIDKFGFEKGFWQYSFQIPAHPMWFNKDEIVYLMEQPRSMSPYGYARTQAILDIIKSLHYSTLYNKRFFEETAIPDGALSLLDTNETEMKAFMSWWNNEFKAQPHKMAVLNKEMKWQPFAQTQRELEFLATQKQYFNWVISEFGLTPAELGITEDLNKSTSATQAELTKRKGIRPFIKLFEIYMNTGILPEFPFNGIEFQFIYDDPAEKSSKLDNWKKELDMGLKTVNEVRNELGLDPIEGGDTSNNPGMVQAQGQPGQTPAENADRDQTDQQTPGYKEDLEEGQAYNEQRDQKSDNERRDALHHPYGTRTRPVGNFKSAKFRQMSYDDLIEEHKKLVAILESGDPKKIKEEAAEQKKELEEYMNEANKGYVAPVGAYYNDQPISQPRRRSGADSQPQNPKPTNNFPRNNSLRTQPPRYQETNPSHLGDTYAKPGKHTWRSDKDQIHCPMCGQPTLSYLNSLENTQGTMNEDVRCTNCGARFNTQQLLEAKGLEDMYNMITANNSIEPVSIPAIKPKGMTKSLDMDMTTKDYAGFDVSKSLGETIAYAASEIYRATLKDYLTDLSDTKVKSIQAILQNGIARMKGMREIARQIESTGVDRDRAEKIARTEVIRLTNEGNLERINKKGGDKVIFIASPEDGRRCEECADKDGQVSTVKEARNIVPLHPMCRCCWSEYYTP